MTISGSSIRVNRAFIGAGCNRIVNNVSWGPCDLVAFGAQNAVAIFCPKTAQILTTAPGHVASVNCTYWLPSSKYLATGRDLKQQYLLSGAADGAIILWELSASEGKLRHVLQVPQYHKKGVTCITGIMLSDTEAMFASTSSDGSVYVWKLIFSCVEGNCTLSCLQSLSIGPKFMVALSLAQLPGRTGDLVLAMGGLDNKVYLYSGNMAGQFERACELKGHTDWIRCLDFSLLLCFKDELNALLLVSSSQDKCIRIWKVVSHSLSSNSEVNCRVRERGLLLYIEGPTFVAGSSLYQVSLESLLVGHEDWVYSVQWKPPRDSSVEGYSSQSQCILSASMDKTMMIWQPEKTTGIWINVVTVGELSHCALGFYGGHWSPNGDSILAHGYGGSFHLWRNSDNGTWKPQKVPSGHYDAVADIAWDRFGEYVLSVGHDQTSRIFAPWKNEAPMAVRYPWHEIARPQVHGHDINCVTIIQGAGNCRFVSGADEKVARVFEAPLSFLKTLNYAIPEKDCLLKDLQVDVQILGANMSALGLSQKPIYVQAVRENEGRKEKEDMETLESIPDAVPSTLTEPPVEEQLAWHTLWPESHKLYGHGNEIFSLCCNHKGTFMASSCKAQSASVAEIWLWEVGPWRAISRLQSHNLTVTNMQFSHDDKFLLSVSRDRKFSVFSITGEGGAHLVAKQEAHKRIIWACCWSPFGPEFATGSRDKTVKIWAVEGGTVKQLVRIGPFSSSVTALSWAGLDPRAEVGLLSVGMESGMIELWRVCTRRSEGASAAAMAACVVELDPFMCHVAAVNRLAWKECSGEEDGRCLRLASCGADHCVRVFDVIVG